MPHPKTNNAVIRGQGYYRAVDGDGIRRELSDHEGEDPPLVAQTGSAEARADELPLSAPPVVLEQVLPADRASWLAALRQSLPEKKEAALEAVTN